MAETVLEVLVLGEGITEVADAGEEDGTKLTNLQRVLVEAVDVKMIDRG